MHHQHHYSDSAAANDESNNNNTSAPVTSFGPSLSHIMPRHLSSESSEMSRHAQLPPGYLVPPIVSPVDMSASTSGEIKLEGQKPLRVSSQSDINMPPRLIPISPLVSQGIPELISPRQTQYVRQQSCGSDGKPADNSFISNPVSNATGISLLNSWPRISFGNVEASAFSGSSMNGTAPSMSLPTHPQGASSRQRQPLGKARVHGSCKKHNVGPGKGHTAGRSLVPSPEGKNLYF